jgi:hypothetical protein
MSASFEQHHNNMKQLPTVSTVESAAWTRPSQEPNCSKSVCFKKGATAAASLLVDMCKE